MKTCILILVLFAISCPIFSQNDLVINDMVSDNIVRFEKVKNSSPVFENLSSDIINFQNLVAQYDITSKQIYTPKERATYTVDFKDGNNKITNVYNHEGDVIRNKQKFENVELPEAIIEEVLGTY